MASLQYRLLFTYLFVITVTLLLAAVSLFVLLGGYRDSITYDNLDDLALLVNAQASVELRDAADAETEPQDADLLLALRAFLTSGAYDAASTSDMYIAVADASGAVIAGRAVGPASLDGATIEDAPDAPAAASGEPRQCVVKIDGKTELLCVSTPLSAEVIAAFPGAGAVSLVVAKPATGLGEIVRDLMPRLFFAGLIGTIAALVLGFVFAQSIVAPLRSIARAARSVARGNFSQRAPVTGPREVRELATTFNRMTEEVQRSQQTLRDFLANISHELKTPLTSIRGFSEAMLDGTIDDPEGIERSTRVISNESSRLLRLVQELLDLSRIESGQVSMQNEDIDLDDFLAHISEVFALRGEESGVNLDIGRSGGLHIRGDFDRLEQVLNNLLDNAFRHTPEGGTVRVTARPLSDGIAQITISDTGKGIPATELPMLFQRFYRGSTNGSGKGHGLGLAITREIVRAHGGDIWATSEVGRGTSFTFTLPSVAPVRQRVRAR
ncbi:MAG TPA: HAMP domain-containing sensor histidine kinase [Tepidiformaceae bacterium]|nr:HAMP domain-containing sensor histidine kinase [Tepidiformaceae bacterium]